MKLDILVFAAHPDDAELSCSGTIASHVARGYKVGVVDLTRGELGTRGSADQRDIEAERASRIMKLSARENLKFDDGFFVNDKAHQIEVVRVIRKYQPDIVLANAVHDRHPDHGKAAELVRTAVFLSGLRKIETELNGSRQKEWRPKALYHFIQSMHISPDFVVDVSDFWATKMDSIRAYETQFFNPDSEEPETYISRPDFIDFLEARAREFGNIIGARFGEGFTVNKPLGVDDLTRLG